MILQYSLVHIVSNVMPQISLSDVRDEKTEEEWNTVLEMVVKESQNDIIPSDVFVVRGFIVPNTATSVISRFLFELFSFFFSLHKNARFMLSEL